jgi:Family of unknown function (DUF6444)
MSFQSGALWMLTPAAPAKIDTRLWALPFAPPEWALTPPAVPAHVQRLQQRVYQREPQVETLPGRVERTSHTASKPPSSASPFHKPPRKPRASGGPRGARPGHPGHGPTWVRPTAVRLIAPAPCACGHGALLSLAPSYPHQVIALPPMERDILHCVLHHGIWAGGGTPRKAQGPPAPQAGDGPRVTARIGARAGRHRTSWRLVQDCCHSVWPMPLSLGAVPTMLTRVAPALVPPSEAIAT